MNKKCCIILLLCTILVIPFLGIYDYNTKGEPRESLVSLNMLESGNWILPRNSVGEIAYKPPFFHWAVAATSAVVGEVNEFTSRIPSALAFILLTVITYAFFRRRSQESTALITAAIVFTCNELHRQGFNCRVDMLLTFFIVAAMYELYRWWERGCKGIPLIAILMMSLGTLTKGPIGALLPCLVMGTFMLLPDTLTQNTRTAQSSLGKRLLRAFAWMAAIGTLSLIIPACWYYAAWRQAGDEFFSLMMEENVGRMTGTMSYKVHEGAWYMNLVYVISGLLPWTILLLFSLFGFRYRRLQPFRRSIVRLMQRVAQQPPLTLYTITAVAVILIFFTIPECKRSVYLMPLYPFLAYLIALYLKRIAQRKPKTIMVYGSLLSVLGLIVVVLLVALRFISLPDGLFHGRNAYDNAEMVANLSTFKGIIPWMVVLLLTAVCVYWWWFRKKKTANGLTHLYSVIVLTLAVYLCFNAVLKPPILNAKSVKHIAQQIERIVPPEKGKLYEYIEKGVQAKGDPVHFYELNFYLRDRIGNFHTQRPAEGYLLIGDEDVDLRMDEFKKQGYRFHLLYTSAPEPVFKQTLHLYSFSK